MNKKFAGALLGITVAVGASACTPDQYRTWLEIRGANPADYTDKQIEDGAKVATWFWEQKAIEHQQWAEEQARIEAEQASIRKYDYVLSDASLARLRQCESGGNYNITSPGGAYRGAYQFATSTWNAVAGRHFPELIGVDPAYAAPEAQDAMARALYLEMGRSPWPVCGRYL